MEAGYWSFGPAPFLLVLTCLAIIVVRTSGNKEIRLIDWSLLFIALVYGIMAPFVLSLIMRSQGEFVGANFVQAKFGDEFGYHAVAVFAVVLGLLVGWGLRRPRSEIPSVFSGLGKPKEFAHWFWILAAIALVAQYIYTVDYGGLLGILEYSARLRAGVLDESDRSRFSFLAPLSGFSMISCYGFFGLILHRESRPRGAWLGFLATFALSVYVLISLQGRMGVVVFIASLVLGAVLVRSRGRLVLVAGFPFAVVAGTGVLRFAAEMLRRDAGESSIGLFTRELSFVYTGFWAWADSGNLSYRYFYDLMVGPLFLLPSSWTTGRFSKVGDVHTTQMAGAPKGVGDVTGAMQLDLVTIGYLQFGMIGVFICAVAFGVVLRSLQRVVDGIEIAGVRAVAEAHVALKVAGMGLFYAEPENLIRGNLPLIVLLVAGWYLHRKRGRVPR